MEIYKQGTKVFIPQERESDISAEVICVNIWGQGTRYEVGYWKDKEYKTVWLFENQFTLREETVKEPIGFKGMGLPPFNQSNPQPLQYQPLPNMQKVDWDATNVFDMRLGCPKFHQMEKFRCHCGPEKCERNEEAHKIIQHDVLKEYPNITCNELNDLYPENHWGKTKLIAMLKFGCTRGNINGTQKLSKELNDFVMKELYPPDGIPGKAVEMEAEPDTSKEIPLVEGSQCPKCNDYATYGDEGSLVSSTPSIFKEEPDPHYSWVETHKCKSCGTSFRFFNGTRSL